jgi:hypothetical protein
MHRAVVAELAEIVQRVRQSLGLIEAAIASGTAVEEAVADNVIVLDDVTPGYARADAALRECEAGLGAALHLLQGPMISGGSAVGFAAESRLPADRWPISA